MLDQVEQQRLGPVEIVDREHHRLRAAPPVDESEDRFGSNESEVGRRRGVGVREARTAQHAGDATQLRVRRRMGETTRDRRERHALLEFLSGTEGKQRPAYGRAAGDLAQQSRLADAWFAPYEQDVTLPG